MNYLIWSLMAALIGCGGRTALSNVKVDEECKGTEFSCTLAGLNAPLALGGAIALQTNVELPGVAGAELQTHSVREDIVEVNGDLLFGKAEGMSALMLMTGSQVVDFLHVQVLPATDLVLTREGDGATLQDKIDLLLGDELLLTYRPKNGSQFLSGLGQDTWAQSGNALHVLRTGMPGVRRVVAKEAGTTTISIEAFGLERQLEVEVLQ